MIFKPLQLGTLLIPNTYQLSIDTQEGQGFEPYAFKNGVKVFDTPPPIKMKTLSLTATVVDDRTKTPDQIKALRQAAFDFIQSIRQSVTTLYAIGQNDRIYKLEVRVGLPSTNYLDQFANGFTVMIPMVATDTNQSYWEDCQDYLYFLDRLPLLSNKPITKYKGDQTFLNPVIPQPFIEQRSWASFKTDDSTNKVFYNTSASGVTVTGTGSSSFITSDVVNQSNTIQIVTGASLTTNTYTFSVAKDMSLNSDSTPVSPFDSLEFDFKNTAKANIFATVNQGLVLTVNTDGSNYLTFDLYKYIQIATDNSWQRIKLILNQGVKTGSGVTLSNINYITISTKNTGSAATVKFNGFYVVKRFGLNMTYIPSSGVQIANNSQNAGLELLTLFSDSATIRQVSVDSQTITVPNTARLFSANQDGYAWGNNFYSLVQKGTFETSKTDYTTTIKAISDQPTYSYYSFLKRTI